MGLLRAFLREHSKELCESLERSWETAFDTWLPAIPPNKDTYNSYPHLRNLEVYADKVAAALKKQPKNRGEFLSPLEVYILLASILFHDIGKARGGKDHGKKSESMIRKNWGFLGIPNEELAYSISRICCFHDCSPDDATGKILELTTAVVDPYGTIREREIATVLMLVDHIDGSFIRIVPDFIRGDDEIGILGAFRKKIRGIDVDIEGGMVKVVLGEDGWKREENEHDVVYMINRQRCFKNALIHKEIKEMMDEVLSQKIHFYVFNVKGTKNYQYFARNLQGIITDDKVQKIFKDDNLFRILELKGKADAKPQLKELLVILGFVFVTMDAPQQLMRRSIQKNLKYMFNERNRQIEIGTTANKNNGKKETIPDETRKISDASLLATLLGNTLENVEALQPIKSTLASMGLPIRGWLLEYKDRLFNYLGNETIEPIFTKEYLINAAKCMWKLSTRIFGHGELKFETLAAEMREPDIGRVKRAVRRIGIITMPSDSENKRDYPAIWYSDTGWRWILRAEPVMENGENDREKNDGCRCVTLAEMIDVIKKLEESGVNNAG